MRSSLEDSLMTSFLAVNFAAKFQREHGQRGRRMRGEDRMIVITASGVQNSAPHSFLYVNISNHL